MALRKVAVWGLPANKSKVTVFTLALLDEMLTRRIIWRCYVLLN